MHLQGLERETMRIRKLCHTDIDLKYAVRKKEKAGWQTSWFKNVLYSIQTIQAKKYEVGQVES